MLDFICNLGKCFLLGLFILVLWCVILFVLVFWTTALSFLIAVAAITALGAVFHGLLCLFDFAAKKVLCLFDFIARKLQ